MAILVEFRADEVRNYFYGIQEKFPKEFDRFLYNIALKTGKHYRHHIRNLGHPTGKLEGSVKVKKIGEYRYSLTADAKNKGVQYAGFVETGRRAGKRPPTDDPKIVQYAAEHGISPYLIARSIGRKGTPPRYPLAKALESAQPDIENYLKSEVKRLVKK